MRQSGLLLDDNRDVSEACVTRPLVEIDIVHHWLQHATALDVAVTHQEYGVHTDRQTINKGATLIPILSHPILTRVILTLVAEPYKSRTLVQS